jgi:hypothetical protein
MQSHKNIGIGHVQPLGQAIINLLCAPISDFTYTQTIDGQPIWDVYTADHPFRDGLSISHYVELCSGSIEKARAFYADFDVLGLNFET